MAVAARRREVDDLGKQPQPDRRAAAVGQNRDVLDDIALESGAGDELAIGVEQHEDFDAALVIQAASRQQLDDLPPFVLVLTRIDDADVEPIKIHNHDPKPL